jgi:hypothetical protein
LLSGGPTIEVASDNVDHDDGHYELALSLGAPVKAPYVAGSVPLLFTADAAVQGTTDSQPRSPAASKCSSPTSFSVRRPCSKISISRAMTCVR